jgi:hypothetical protein
MDIMPLEVATFSYVIPYSHYKHGVIANVGGESDIDAI